MLGGTALEAQPAAAKAPLPKSVKSIDAQLKKAAGVLGKRDVAGLRGRLRTARSSLRAGKTCKAVKALTRVVVAARKLRTAGKRSAAAPAAATARSLAKRLIARERSKGACGLKIRVNVRRSLKPAIANLPGLPGAPKRPLVRLRGANATTDFADREIILATRSKTQLRGLLRRTGGKLVKTVSPQHVRTAPNFHLIRLPGKTRSGKSRKSALIADLRKLEPGGRGRLAFSRSSALTTLATAADERARGLHVGLNQLVLPDATVNEAFPGQRFLDRESLEASIESNAALGTANALQWSFLNSDADDSGRNAYGTGEAWRALEIAGKLKPRSVEVAVIDGGFVSLRDLPPGTTRTSSAPGEGGSETHGYDVSQTLAAQPDNGIGVAGSGGPVVDLRSIHYDFDGLSVIERTFDAINTGARVINMSIGSELDALVSGLNVWFEDATRAAAAAGVLVVVSAGNDNRDVDAEDCFFVCWEEEWIAPCENAGVLCVGGVDRNRFTRADDGISPETGQPSGSNFGIESCESKFCSVEIFGPYRYPVDFVRSDGTRRGATRIANGTSFASPYVAGVAALVIAADPTISLAKLRQTLIDTSNSSPDAGVSRVVDAQDAVNAVLPTPPPLVGIATPKPGSYNWYPQRFDGLAVSTIKSCCTYHWRDTKHGFLGNTPLIDVENALMGGAGPRTVELTATDGAGRAGTATVDFSVVAGDPRPVIEEPKADGVFYTGASYKFRGYANDPDGLGTLPCDRLTWTVDRGAGTPTVKTGCQPVFDFGVVGQKTVTLEATSFENKKGSAQVKIQVNKPPLNAPPIVTVTKPDDDDVLDPYAQHVLEGHAVDSDQTGSITYEWRVFRGDDNTGTVIGNAAKINWRPNDHVAPSPGGQYVRLQLKATDSDGFSGVDSAENVLIAYPPH